jgi:hypothetical protein
MRKSNFALRLTPSLLDEARKLADALNQLIKVAVAGGIPDSVDASDPLEWDAHGLPQCSS